MYIKHMRLVCSTVKKTIPNVAFLDLGPLRVYATVQALYRRFYQYRWSMGQRNGKLFRLYQSVQITRKNTLYSPCTFCDQKAKCLLVSSSENEGGWPGDTCQYTDGELRTLPDRLFRDRKVTDHKAGFVLEHKCKTCGLSSCCGNYSLILRILCKNHVERDVLFGLAEKRINETWGSINRFTAGLNLGWNEVRWKLPEAMRERRYRIAFVHPDSSLQLIQPYYPYRLRPGPVHAKELGLVLEEKEIKTASRSNMAAAWVLWKMVEEQLDQSKNRKHTNLGRFYICGHCNFLLSIHIDSEGHPVLTTATSRYKFNVTFHGLDDIGYKLGWSPSTLLQYFQ